MTTKTFLIFGIPLLVMVLLLGGRCFLMQNRGDVSQDRSARDGIEHIFPNRDLPSATPATSSTKSNSAPPPTGGNAVRADILANLDMESNVFLDKADKDIELELHLLEREKVDPELFSKWEMAESERAKAPTKALLSHLIDSPITTMFGVYDDVNIGIERAARSCKTMKAFLERPDIAEAVGTFYDSFRYSPEDMTEKDREFLVIARSTKVQSDYSKHLADKTNESQILIGRRSIQLYKTDQLVCSPLVLDRLKGHEKQILAALVRRFRSIETVRAKHGNDAYTAASSTAKSLSVALLENIDAGLAKQTTEIDYDSEAWEKCYYANIEALLRSIRDP